MKILSKAEFDKLTEHERAEYWRGRYYDMQEAFTNASDEAFRLRRLLFRIRDVAGGA